MIYQSDKNYIFFPFKAVFSSTEQYVADKAEFEAQLKTGLQEEENRLAMSEGREPIQVAIPFITYVDLVHSTEEIARLLECQDSNGQLDDVRCYVLNGVFPNKAHSLMYIETTKLKEKIGLASAQNTGETLQLISALNEAQQIKQAQSNAEMITLIMTLGGM